MEALLKARCAASKERKRKRDEIGEGFSVLRATSLHDLRQMEFTNSEDIVAMLCIKFGWKTVFILGSLLSNLPQVITSHLEEHILAGSFGELEKIVTLDELHVLVELLRKYEEFLDFSYENSVAAISESAGIPLHRILYPPITACSTCGWSLQIQSQPASVTVFEKDEPLPGIKFSFKC